jgi:protein required for attachment to host cells
MAKTNFAYEKRQRELEKKKKQEEKARRKAELKNNPGLAQEGEEDLAEGETSGLAPNDDEDEG